MKLKRFFSREKPKIKEKKAPQKAEFSGWRKCDRCHEMIHDSELKKNLWCCPKCSAHYQLGARERIEMLADEGSFREFCGEIGPVDALKFVDRESYATRLKRAQESSKESEAVIVGECQLEGIRLALGVMDFSFMVGSMGSVVGERLTRLIEYAQEEAIPLVIVSASGGARMQESILSLMQMAKTSAALARLHDKGIPFISVLTDPTSGGVTASFASLGDVILAEPDALVCFAGPRVVEQVIRQKLPPKAQKSEFLLEHGMIDAVVMRHALKKTLASILNFITPQKKLA